MARRRTKEEFIKESIEKYGEGRFGYDKVEYVNSYTKVKVFCTVCNEYVDVLPSHFLKRSIEGCPKCGNRKAGEKLRTPQDVWIDRAKEKWGDVCDYKDTVYLGSNTKVRIFCKEHQGYFEQWPNTHLNAAYGCPECSFKHEASQSLGEKEIERVLLGLGITSEREYIINDLIDGRNSRKLRIDFRYYIGPVEHWIEFHGEQHYTEIRFFSHGDPEWFKKQQERDQNVRDYCKANGIRLLEIPYTYQDHFKIYSLITEFNSGATPEISVPGQNKTR